MSEQSPQSLEEVNDTLYRKGRTDGLPVVPPTERRVDEMLRGTDLPRDHELGRLGNRKGILTVEKLAINGVMAGCKPIHMPVLVAGAKAYADPESNSIQFAVSTGSWAYFTLMNGPIREEIDVRTDTAAFDPGFRANRTIGRALGLMYQNTADIYPGGKKMAVQGSPFRYSLVAGENEENSPFEPLHVTQGFDEEDSTITICSPQSFAQHYTMGTPDVTAQGVLKQLLDNTGPALIGLDLESRRRQIIYALAPYNAQELGDAGLTKDEIKEYLYENGSVQYSRHLDEDTQVEYEVKADDKVPPYRIPQFESPDCISIIVTGGAGRVNAIMGQSLSKPVTKKIEFPDNWDELLNEYTVKREWGERTTPGPDSGRAE